MKYSKSRRDFIKNGIYGLGIFMLPFPKGLFEAKAATKGKRQHLINIVDIGGWDTTWYYSFFDPNLNSVVDRPPSGQGHLNKLRYGANDYTTFNGQKLAPGMKFFNGTDLSRLLIWKGATMCAGHSQNNFFLSGGESPYNSSYSSLISAYQADTRGPSTLHYVKLSGSSQDFFVLPGMMTGLAVPTCIPSQTSWSKLTSASQNASMRTATSVNDAIAQLAAIADKRVTRKASKGVIEGFSTGYSGANLLSTSEYGNSPAFLGMWLRYLRAMKQEAVDQLASGYGTLGDFQSDIRSALTPLTNFATNNTNDLFQSSSDAYVNLAKDASWKFAMSAFLVINDLSAVVDINPSGADAHTATYQDYLARMFGIAGHRELTRHLSTIDNPEGGKLLDVTLLTYTSEFDRNPIFNNDEMVSWGTGHGQTFSALMSGHKTNVGRIVGSSRIGDSNTVATELRGVDNPVATDPNSGQVGGSSILNPKSILPTVLQMFGISVPLRQVTEFRTIPVLIKS